MAMKDIQYHHVQMDEDTFYHYRHINMEVKTKVSGGADVGVDGLMLFASTGTEIAFASLFIPDMYLAGSVITPHLEWGKTTDAAGDVVWQIRHRHIIPQEVPLAMGEWTDITHRHGTLASTQVVLIDQFPNVAASTSDHGAMIQFDIRRKHDDADDDYGADAKLWAFAAAIRVSRPGQINNPMP